MRVPQTVEDDDGRTLVVRRAWPHGDGRLTVEAVDEGTGRLRAGFLRTDGSARMAAFAEDPALPGLPAAAEAGELLVHRFRKRAVVRSEGAFLKVLPRTKVADVAHRHGVATELTLGSGIDVPRVIGVGNGTVTLSALPGRSLHDLCRPGAGVPWTVVEQGWHAWAARWPRFVRSAGSVSGSVPGSVPGSVSGSVPGSSAVTVPSHGPEDEVRTLDTWVERCRLFGAFAAEDRQLAAAANRARARLTGGTPQHAVLAHRDLHDKQLFLGDGQGPGKAVGLIDCDTLALAEPALDLANLLVHLEFREAQGLLSAPRRASGEAVILDVAATLEVPEDRLAAYILSTRVRLACVYAFRPRWRELASEWLRAV